MEKMSTNFVMYSGLEYVNFCCVQDVLTNIEFHYETAEKRIIIGMKSTYKHPKDPLMIGYKTSNKDAKETLYFDDDRKSFQNVYVKVSVDPATDAHRIVGFLFFNTKYQTFQMTSSYVDRQFSRVWIYSKKIENMQPKNVEYEETPFPIQIYHPRVISIIPYVEFGGLTCPNEKSLQIVWVNWVNSAKPVTNNDERQ